MAEKRHYYVEGVRLPLPPMEDWTAEELEQYMAACALLDPEGYRASSKRRASPCG
jgi:hypothetical protein